MTDTLELHDGANHARAKTALLTWCHKVGAVDCAAHLDVIRCCYVDVPIIIL